MQPTKCFTSFKNCWGSLLQWYSVWFGRWTSLNDDEKRRWKVQLSLFTPLLSLQVGTATKCVPGPTWMGMGWGKELISAFFFVIMRGPYDALLPWPFWQKVTLTLINQAGKKHQSDKFLSWPPLQLLSATREKGDEHCVWMPHVCLDQTPAEWKLWERWLNIRTSVGGYFGPPKDHLMKALRNSNLKWATLCIEINFGADTSLYIYSN